MMTIDCGLGRPWCFHSVCLQLDKKVRNAPMGSGSTKDPNRHKRYFRCENMIFYMLLAGLFLRRDKTLYVPFTFSIIQNTSDCILPMYIIDSLISLIFQFHRDLRYSISCKICSWFVVFILFLVYIAVLMGLVCFVYPYSSGLYNRRCYDYYDTVRLILKIMD